MSDALAQQRIDGINRALQARGWQDVAVVEEEAGYPFNDMEGEFHYRGGIADLLRDDASILSPQTSSPEEWIDELEEKVQDQVLDKGADTYDWDWDMFPESYRTMDRVFGYTDSLQAAGYILPNGKLLDLSQGQGQRVQDHRAVSNFRPGGSPGTAGMQEFVSEGNIRMDANSGILDISAPPTDRQKRRIREVAKLHRGEITVDMKDGLGEKDDRDDRYYSPEKSERISFPLGTNPATIVNRIDNFFSMYPVEAGLAGGHLLKWAQRQQFMLPLYDPEEYTTNPDEIEPNISDFTPEGEYEDEWATGFYHVTSNLPAVLNTGELRSRRQLGDKAIGLGGGWSDVAPGKISVTHNYNKAYGLASMMRFAASVVHGQVAPSQVLDDMMGRYGDFDIMEGSRLYRVLVSHDIPDEVLWDEGDVDLGTYLDSNIKPGKETYEFIQELDEALMMDHEEGTDQYTGFTLPYERFVKINPDNIGIVQVMVRKDAIPEHVPGELEFRFDPDDVMLLQDQSTVMAKNVHAWIESTCRLARPRGRAREDKDLGHASWVDKDLTFETGSPVEFPFVHMVQETPKIGEMFQQHIDPAGKYMTYNETGKTPPIKTDRIEAQYGMAKFENPLVLMFNTGDEFGYNEHSWKARLHEHYGKSGRALSKAIADDGYDGIVTVRQDVDPPVVSEIVDLRPFARKTMAWLMGNCKFAQDREQLHFPFYDPSEYEPIVEENPEWPDPLYDQKQALQHMLDDRPQEVANFLKVYASLYDPEEVRFDDAASSRKAKPITVVTIDGQRYVAEVSNERFGSLTGIAEWLEDLSEYDLGQYVGFKDFNEEFWDGADGLVLYHATDPDNVEDILRDGLSPRSDSRALSNRNIGSAVFTGPDPEAISSYGSAVIAINVGAMKANGYMPRASQEEPFEKTNMKEALAHKLGIEDYYATDEYHGEGLSEDTVVFFGPIPPQYLSLAE